MLTSALASAWMGVVRQGRGSACRWAEVMLARAVVSLTSASDACCAAASPPGANAAPCCSAAPARQRGALLRLTAPWQACRWPPPRCGIPPSPPSQPCWPGPCWGERLNGRVLLAAALGWLGVVLLARSGPCWLQSSPATKRALPLLPAADRLAGAPVSPPLLT